MSTSVQPPTLHREGDHFTVIITEEEAARRGLHEGQLVEVQPLMASRSSSVWGIVETVFDVFASKVALAQYRRHGKAVARNADDVLADLNL